MGLSEVLKSVQVVVGPDGKPSAVQIGIDAWASVLDRLEEAEDRADVRAWLSKLREGPQKAGATAWATVRGEWESSEGEPPRHAT